MFTNCCMFFFFFKQKTAYEMRISDLSSDVCSSDLGASAPGRMIVGILASAARSLAKPGSAKSSMEAAVMPTAAMTATFRMRLILSVKSAADEPNLSKQAGDYGPVRTEESRVGKEWGRT